jgi:outer membrane protein assembly factor BamB
VFIFTELSGKIEILMDKIILILAVIFLASPQAFTQKEMTVLSNSMNIGKNLVTGEPVLANEYTLSERIHDFQIDTLNKYMTIQLRGLSKNGKWLDNMGYVVRYDLEEKKVLWYKHIAYENSNIEQYGGVTLYTTGPISYCLNNETGEQIWKVENSLIIADPFKKIGIGYKVQAYEGLENMLEGIDLTTGKPIWQREISREYSWNDVFYLNDSTLLISASGLHTVNIYDGTGWDYYTVTGKKDYTASTVGTGVGIISGLLTGVYSVSTGHNLVRDVCSNVFVDSANIYFASREHLAKLNRNGEVLWQKSLPDDLTSKSLIFTHDTDIIMVNKGCAYMGYRQLDFGTPFIASFDINNGEQNFLKTVSRGKKEIIKGIDFIDGDLILVFKDHISKYSINDGESIIDQQFNIEKSGVLFYFVSDQVFVQRDSLFISLPDLDSTKHYLYTESGRILVLNSDLEIGNEIEPEDCYLFYLDKNDKKFIAQGYQTFVIDKNGRKMAEFSASRLSVFLNNKLYDAREISFLEISLERIIESPP